jgi:hypothetical protein
MLLAAPGSGRSPSQCPRLARHSVGHGLVADTSDGPLTAHICASWQGGEGDQNAKGLSSIYRLVSTRYTNGPTRNASPSRVIFRGCHTTYKGRRVWYAWYAVGFPSGLATSRRSLQVGTLWVCPVGLPSPVCQKAMLCQKSNYSLSFREARRTIPPMPCRPIPPTRKSCMLFLSIVH